MDTGLLLLHAFAGAALVAHALQKLLVFRVDGTAAYLDALDATPAVAGTVR